MVQFSAYEPDPDITDEIGYGWFTAPDGRRSYGYDPDEAQRLQDLIEQNDQRTAELSDVERDLQVQLGPDYQRLRQDQAVPDVAQPVPGVPEQLPPAAQQPAVAPAVEPQAPQDANALSVQIPESSRIASVHNNPGNLMFAGQEGATKGEAKEGGGYWAKFETPEAGYNALRRQIALDAGRGHTLSSFIGKYAPEFENNVAAYLKNVSGFTGADPDTPISQINPDALARAMARQESSTIVGGEPGEIPQVSAAPPQPGSPALPGGMQLPQVPGMLPAQVTMQGAPMSPADLQARQQQVMDSTLAQMGALQAGAQGRIQGRQEAMQDVQANHERYVKSLEYRQQHDNAVRNVAQQQIQQELTEPIQKVDPLRIIKEASTGSVILGFIGILLESGFAGARGAPIPNTLGRLIEQDVGLQRDEIARGDARRQNRVAHWTRVMNDAQSGVEAATAELEIVTARRIENLAQTKVENADIQAQAMQASQQLMDLGMQRIQAITDQRAQKLSVTYAPPAPPPAGALGGAAPELAPVGVEDQSPQARAQIANGYDSKNPAHRGQFNTLTKEMQQITQLEQNLRRFEQVYAVQADESGAYPGDAPNYNSSATGPDPFEAWDEDSAAHERARIIRDLWSQVELDTRMGWVTEPNGDTTQIRLSGIQKPKLDADVPRKLAELRQEIERRKMAIMSGTQAPVRAAWKLQNQYPIAGGVSVKPVSGVVGAP